MSRMSAQASSSATPAVTAADRARPSSVSLKSTPVTRKPWRASSIDWRPKPQGASSTRASGVRPATERIQRTSRDASSDVSTAWEMAGHASRKKRSLWNTRAIIEEAGGR